MKRQILTVLVLGAIIAGWILIGAPSATQANHGTGDYRPTSGTTQTSTHYDGTRYITQTYRWSSERLAAFEARGSNVTYEHDFRLNNYPQSSLPGVWAVDVTYWDSNMPDAYLDSRFGDPAEELAFTIGTTDALKLEPYPDKSYNSHMHVANGNADEDNARLAGDIGHRLTPFCGGAWCVADDHHLDIVPAWDIAVPSYHPWSTE